MWLTVGGNDVMNGLSQGMTMEQVRCALLHPLFSNLHQSSTARLAHWNEIFQVLAKLATDTAVILDHMKKSAPNVTTIQFGYDIPK